MAEKTPTYLQTHEIFWIDNCSFFRVRSGNLLQLSSDRKRKRGEVKGFLMSTLACVIKG